MNMRPMLNWTLRKAMGKARYDRLYERALAHELEKATARAWPPGRAAPVVSIGKTGDETEDFIVRAGSVDPGKPAKVYITRFGVVTNSADGATVHALDGSVTTMHPDGASETRDPAIRRISIHDVREIVGIRSARVYGTASHTIEFVGGGTLGYVTDQRGRLLEICLRKMACITKTDTGVMTVYRTGEMLPADGE